MGDGAGILIQMPDDFYRAEMAALRLLLAGFGWQHRAGRVTLIVPPLGLVTLIVPPLGLVTP